MPHVFHVRETTPRSGFLEPTDEPKCRLVHALQWITTHRHSVILVVFQRNPSHRKDTQINNLFARVIKSYPVFCFIGIAYLWSYLITVTLLLVLKAQGANQLFGISLAAFGPAVAGIIVARALNDKPAGLSPVGFFIGALGATVSCSILVLGLTGMETEIFVSATRPTLSTYLLMASSVCLSGLIYSHSLASADWSRNWFSKMLPDRKTLVFGLAVLCFFPTLMIGTNLLARAIGLTVTEPKYLQTSAAIWIPAMLLKVFTVFFMTGGNEEHGWRGVLLPLVQVRMKPIFAALLIGVIWELWHAPLVFSGIYGDGNPFLIILVQMVTTILFSYLLTFVFNVSSGSIFLCVLMHSCINTQINLFAGTDLARVTGAVVIVGLIVVTRMWRKDSGYISALQTPQTSG